MRLNNSIVDCGEFIIIIFDKNKQSSRAGKQPKIGNKRDPQMDHLRRLNYNNPEILEYRFKI